MDKELQYFKNLTLRKLEPESKKVQEPLFSKQYLEWVGQSKLPPLTNNQHRFAELLLKEENAKIIGQIGSFDEIFASIRNWIKNK
jgi:hypothetical protein